MATVQLPSPITIAGTTYSTAQVIVVSPQRSQMQTILPKQEPTVQAPVDQVKVECPKRRIHFSKKALNHPRPQSVTRRNTRERNRVRAVNQGFVTLANHVPTHLRSKKMSKVDTLKAAIVYIQELRKVLGNDSSPDTDTHSSSDNDSLSSLPDSSPEQQDYSENFYYESSTPISDDYTESYSSPCSSMSTSPSYHSSTPLYYQTNQTTCLNNSIPQQYPTNFSYPTQTPQWSSESTGYDDYQQCGYRHSWAQPTNPLYSNEETEEESILDLVSLMF